MDAKELEKDVVTSYTKMVEDQLLCCCAPHIPDKIILSALGNLLIRKCKKLNVDKKNFLKLMNEGWDYHSEEE